MRVEPNNKAPIGQACHCCDNLVMWATYTDWNETWEIHGVRVCAECAYLACHLSEAIEASEAPMASGNWAGKAVTRWQGGDLVGALNASVASLVLSKGWYHPMTISAGRAAVAEGSTETDYTMRWKSGE